MITFNSLSIFLAYKMSVRVKNSLICSPSIRKKSLDAKWFKGISKNRLRQSKGFEGLGETYITIMKR